MELCNFQRPAILSVASITGRNLIFHWSRTIKSTIALVLAGGFAEGFNNGNEPVYKALIPVNGRPLAYYVVKALEQSNVEKILILQEEGANLEAVLPPNSKCVFLTKDKNHTSLRKGVVFALEKVAEYYGNSGLDTRCIMVVPCDTPLATKDNYNNLIGKANLIMADIIITIVAEKLLTARFPQRKFRGVYLADRFATYTMQNIIFINGEFIRDNPSESLGNPKFTFRGWDQSVFNRVLGGINDVEGMRHQSNFYDKLFLTWLFTKGYTSYIFKFLVAFAFRRLTRENIIKYLSGADQMRAGIIESEEVEFSGDIDQPDDFETVLGIPWKSRDLDLY